MLYIECCNIIVTFFYRCTHVNATDGLIPLINRFDIILYIYHIIYTNGQILPVLGDRTLASR